MRIPALLFAVSMILFSPQILAEACIITSDDDELPIRMCQQNISIPETLFNNSFCQPQIPDRRFDITLLDTCPAGAYGICQGAKAQGVAYEQSIHYYSDPADAPVLKGYCEQISKGVWQDPQ